MGGAAGCNDGWQFTGNVNCSTPNYNDFRAAFQCETKRLAGSVAAPQPKLCHGHPGHARARARCPSPRVCLANNPESLIPLPRWQRNSERKGRRRFDTAIEYGTAAVAATEMMRTTRSAVRLTSLCGEMRLSPFFTSVYSEYFSCAIIGRLAQSNALRIDRLRRWEPRRVLPCASLPAYPRASHGLGRLQSTFRERKTPAIKTALTLAMGYGPASLPSASVSRHATERLRPIPLFPLR
jgi:hypothetical protein